MRYGPRGRTRFDMPQRADGRGRQLRELRMQSAYEQEMRESEAIRMREQSRERIAAPVLRSLAEIRSVVENGPEHPIYILKRQNDTTIRAIGHAVFGEEGYNRHKKESADRGIGPHFDAYANHFSPWTIHQNNGRVGAVRAGFLPEDIWQNYVKRTDGLTKLHSDEQRIRFALGKKYFEMGEPLTSSKIGDGSLTLIWHGSLERPDLPPPSVHEFVALPFVVGISTIEKPNSYEIFAQQLKPGVFEGFSAV